jgi:hypothetical protein
MFGPQCRLFRHTELWRMRKDEREGRCAPVYLPTSFDVRFFEGDVRIDGHRRGPRVLRS